MLLLQLLLLFLCAYIYVIKRAGLGMVFGKKRKTSFFFFFFFFLALFRSYLIDAIFDDDVLSLFSFSCRWDSICSLKAHTTNYDSTTRERERDKIIAYTIGTSEAAIPHQNTTTVGREEGGGETSGEIIFYFDY